MASYSHFLWMDLSPSCPEALISKVPDDWGEAGRTCGKGAAVIHRPCPDSRMRYCHNEAPESLLPFLFRRSSMASRFHSGPPDDFNDPGADDALFFESLFEEAEREVRTVRQVRSSRYDALAGKAKPEEQGFRRRASAEPNRALGSQDTASARFSRSRTAAFGSCSSGVSRTRSVSASPAGSPFMPPPAYPKEPPP